MRNPQFEDDYLEAAARRAGVAPREFIEFCRQRLAQGGKEYGENAWLTRSLADFAEQMKEEGADLAAWSVLAAQLPGIDQGLREWLHEIATEGARAFILSHRLEADAESLRINPHDVDHHAEAMKAAAARAEHDRKLVEIPE